MAKFATKAHKEIQKTLKKLKKDELKLHKKVTSLNKSIAHAISEARKAGKKVLKKASKSRR